MERNLYEERRAKMLEIEDEFKKTNEPRYFQLVGFADTLKGLKQKYIIYRINRITGVCYESKKTYDLADFLEYAEALESSSDVPVPDISFRKIHKQWRQIVAEYEKVPEAYTTRFLNPEYIKKSLERTVL